MPKKLSMLEQDILSLLQKTEPSMLLWREIKARLWPLHKTRYKNEKVFGVALSNYLTRNEGKLWKHQGDYYGTFKSFPQAESDVSVTEIRREIAKIKEDYISHHTNEAFTRLVLLADQIDELQPHPSIVYAQERKKLIDRFSVYHPVIPLREQKFKRAIIRVTLKKLESILME